MFRCSSSSAVFANPVIWLPGITNLTVNAARALVADGPQALTGVAATNLCGKRLAGPSIGFISLFSYVGASLSGMLCGTLVQTTGGWGCPVSAIAVTVGVGAVVFLMLWRTRSGNY